MNEADVRDAAAKAVCAGWIDNSRSLSLSCLSILSFRGPSSLLPPHLLQEFLWLRHISPASPPAYNPKDGPILVRDISSPPSILVPCPRRWALTLGLHPSLSLSLALSLALPLSLSLFSPWLQLASEKPLLYVQGSLMHAGTEHPANTGPGFVVIRTGGGRMQLYAHVNPRKNDTIKNSLLGLLGLQAQVLPARTITYRSITGRQSKKKKKPPCTIVAD